MKAGPEQRADIDDKKPEEENEKGERTEENRKKWIREKWHNSQMKYEVFEEEEDWRKKIGKNEETGVMRKVKEMQGK